MFDAYVNLYWYFYSLLEICFTFSLFMNKEAIFECLMSIKIKNTEGFDRIPQRILVDGCVNLIDPLTELFGIIYNHNPGYTEESYTQRATPNKRVTPKQVIHEPMQ